jgi:hypothetical protein
MTALPQDIRRRLRELGVSEKAISNLTPTDAQWILDGGPAGEAPPNKHDGTTSPSAPTDAVPHEALRRNGSVPPETISQSHRGAKPSPEPTPPKRDRAESPAPNGSQQGDDPGDAGFDAAGTDDNDDGPLRDPAIDRAFVKLKEGLEAADNDLAKMRAIRDCAEALEPLGNQEAVHDLTEMGHACGISPDNIEAMEGIIEQGFEIARQKRARTTDPPRTNGGIRQDGTRREREAPESQQWPIPHPLPDNLLPVAPFDLNLVPKELQPWVADVCERMQCPPDYICVSLMAALGSLIGRKIAIRPQVHNDWTVISNMWALLIGRPGVLKSPAMEEALRPLRKLSAMAEEVLKKEYATYEVSASVAKLRHDQNVKKAAGLLNKDPKADVSSLLEPEQQTSEPTLKRYIANDTNVASLGVLLQQNPNGLLVFRDEIVSLLDNLDREECVGERGFYLTGWNGDSRYTFDRIGRGLHLTIDGV